MTTTTVGSLFKKLREQKGIDIKTVEKYTHIRSLFLEALEKNDWSVFESHLYIEGVIKKYADFLGIKNEKAIAFFRRDHEFKEEAKLHVNRYFLSHSNFSRKITLGSLTLLILLALIFFAYQIFLYQRPPTLKIIQPKEEVFVKKTGINIVGQADIESEIFIFNKRVYQDQDGIFSYFLPLKKGENFITIIAIGANGQKNAIKKIFILK